MSRTDMLHKERTGSRVVRRIGVMALRGVIIVALGLVLAIIRVSRIESIPAESGWRLTKTKVGYRFG